MIPMKKVWEARRMVMRGYSTREISEYLKVSISSVRAYTKQERSAVKNRNY